MGSSLSTPGGGHCSRAFLRISMLMSTYTATGLPIGGRFLPFDLSPLPDGRLLCTAKGKNRIIVFDPKDKSQKAVFSMPGIHSVVHLGARKKPSVMPSMVDPFAEVTECDEDDNELDLGGWPCP